LVERLERVEAQSNAVTEAERRHRELVERLERVEAQSNAVAEKLRRFEEGLVAPPPPGLPPASAAQPAPALAELTADGLRLDGEAVDLARFEALLRERVKAQPDLRLGVRAEKDVDYARVTAVLDLAKSVGVARLAIITEPSKP
jgi:hypothetical protein